MSSNKTLLEIAKSKAAATRLARTLSTKDLVRAIANLKSAADNIEKAEAAKVAKSRLANLKQLEHLLKKVKLSPEELKALAARSGKAESGQTKKVHASKRGPKKGTKVPPKYKLKRGDKTLLWSGRGRMPLILKEYVEAGGSLERCLIKK